MTTFRIALTAVVITSVKLSAQQTDLKTTLLGQYTRTLAAIEAARTPADIDRSVDAMDTQDWTSIDADGTRMTRDDAKRQLVRSLNGQPVHQPAIELLWVNQSGDSATAVAWVFAKSQLVDAAGEYGPKGVRHQILVGALIRDSWTLTRLGWRRRVHEKIFPNRVLAVDGKSVVSPA